MLSTLIYCLCTCVWLIGKMFSEASADNVDDSSTECFLEIELHGMC